MQDWVAFWKFENITRDVIWHNNMKIFTEKSQEVMDYNENDIVLDIGSGPCQLIKFLQNQVKEIHCLDISDNYLNQCKHKFSIYDNVYFYKINESNFTNLSFLGEKKFSKIICLSVIQYYNNMQDVEDLILEVKSRALPGSKFLIADIPFDSGKMTDIIGLMKVAWKEKFIWEVLKYLFDHIISDYRNIRAKNGLLVFSDELLNTIIAKNNLNAEILSAQMTTNERRKHLLIHF